jgi:tRNA(Arg) A34 adenosine deaminase TadA
MATLKEFFNARKGKLVAGVLDSYKDKGYWYNDFTYVVTPEKAAVPAHVYMHNWCLNNGRRNATIWVNTMGDYDWLNTYGTYFTVLPDHYREAGYKLDNTYPLTGGSLYLNDTFTQTTLGPEPGLSGLYAQEIAETDNKGLNRARRYYMLASYCLLAKANDFTHRGIEVNNLVGAILVSDSGKILSFGVNTGQYRHAEVNTLLNYFRRTGETTLPAKSTLFSTLKPCLMCSTYIERSLPGDSPTLVWFGQMDPGPAGSAKAEVSKAFDSGKGNKPVKVPTVRNFKGRMIHEKVDISGQLEQEFGSDGRRLAAASWTKQSTQAKKLFQGSLTAMEGKMTKDRSTKTGEGRIGPATLEEDSQRTKQKVLAYLRPWVEGGFK